MKGMHLAAAAAALCLSLHLSWPFDSLKNLKIIISVTRLFPTFMMTSNPCHWRKLWKFYNWHDSVKGKNPVFCRLILKDKKIFQKKKNVMKLKHIYLSISIYASVFWAILSEQEERLRDRPFVVIHFHSSNSVTREWIFSTSHTIGGKQWVQGD